MGLPRGTVTFLFTDIEGSTRLLRAAGDDYAAMLEDHRRIIRAAVLCHKGHEVGTEGDSFFIAFARPSDGVNAALTAQRGLCRHPWQDGKEVRVRMGLHTGEASVVGKDYVGLSVHQAARISSAAHGRQILLSATTASLVRETIGAATLLDIGPHQLKDFDDPIGLFQVGHPELPERFDAPTNLAALPTNLPAPATSLVGREREMAEIEQLLRSTRLLSLTGPGGVGKTRLALELAASVIRVYPAGVWLVDLAPVAESTLIAQVIGQSLGLGEPSAGTSWLERVVDHLQGRETLLVFDNCEHVVGACAEVIAHLLSRLPTIRIIATTREALSVPSEIAWRVPSLDMDEGAVELFLERARAHNPGFSADHATVTEICRQLDGIPLAIELAAARTQALSSNQILDRIGERFRLLRGSGRQIERQQTMRAAVDWSYELLDGTERAVLNRASIFVGGFTLEAAEVVCSADDIAPQDVLEMVESLVRKSLVIFDIGEDSGPRYKMLETIRQYAFEKLMESGEASDARTRHRNVFLQLTEDAKQMVDDGEEVGGAALVDRDLGNIRAALEWAPSGDDGQTHLRMIGALFMHFMPRGYIAELIERGRAALDADTAPPSAARLMAMVATSTAAFHHQDLELVAKLSKEGVALAEDLSGDPQIALAHAGILMNAACVTSERGVDTAMCARAVEIGRDAGDDVATAWGLFNYALRIWRDGDLDTAIAALEEAAGLHVSIAWSGMIIPNLAKAHLARGDIERSRALAERYLENARNAGYPFMLIRALGALSAVALEQGDTDLASSSAEEQILIGRELGDVRGAVSGLYALSLALMAKGNHVQAAVRMEEAVGTAGSIGADEIALFALLVGELNEYLGDLTKARSAYATSLDLYREADGIALAHAGLASINALEGCRSATEANGAVDPPKWRRWLPLDAKRPPPSSSSAQTSGGGPGVLV